VRPTLKALDSALKAMNKPPSNALTNAERQARWRARHGGRSIRLDLSIEVAASLKYLRNQWGLSTDKEAAVVAIRALAVQTRKGLQKIELTID